MSTLSYSTKVSDDAHYIYDDISSTTYTEFESKVDLKEELEIDDIVSEGAEWESVFPNTAESSKLDIHLQSTVEKDMEVVWKQSKIEKEMQIDGKQSKLEKEMQIHGKQSKVEEEMQIDVKQSEVEKEMKIQHRNGKKTLTIEKNCVKKQRRNQKKGEQQILSELIEITNANNGVEIFTVNDEQLFEYRNKQINALNKDKPACRTCIVSFTTEANLKNHNAAQHSETSHKCIICSQTFDTSDLLQQHNESHYTMYRCKWPDCDFVGQCLMNAERHYSVHESRKARENIERESLRQCPVSDVFECDGCNKRFLQRAYLMRHFGNKRCKCLRTEMCAVCGDKFKDEHELKAHMLLHLDPSHRQHECEICCRRFKYRYRLMEHERTHTGERPYKCDVCGAAFTIRTHLTSHMKRHNISSDTAILKKLAQPRKTSSLVKKPSLVHTRHPAEWRYENYFTKDHSTGKYRCKTCDRVLSNFLKTHVDLSCVEKAPWICKDCSKHFKTKSNLLLHVNAKHKRKYTHLCSVCGSGFITKHLLLNHMHSHSSERSFKCEQCDLTFKYRGGLWSHQQIHKGDGKPYKCEICGAKFTLKGSLKYHMIMHTNERPYECGVCGKTFPLKCSLRNHLKVHYRTKC